MTLWSTQTDILGWLRSIPTPALRKVLLFFKNSYPECLMMRSNLLLTSSSQFRRAILINLVSRLCSTLRDRSKSWNCKSLQSAMKFSRSKVQTFSKKYKKKRKSLLLLQLLLKIKNKLKLNLSWSQKGSKRKRKSKESRFLSRNSNKLSSPNTTNKLI